MKNQKCLVTGGAGFIGSHLSEKLVKCGAKVTILDNLSNGNINNIKSFKKKVKFIKFDLTTNLKNFDKIGYKFDYVFHLAAMADIVPSIEDPNLYFNSNVLATKNLVEYFKNKKIKKIIYAASSSCYGIPKKYPTKEDEVINPQYPYALTKNLGEQIILHWSKVYSIPSISLRFFNVYGPRARTSGTYGAVFGVFLAQLINNKPLTVVGDGSQKRDFTFVGDVVDAIISAANSNYTQEIFNVGSGNPVSVNRIVALLKHPKIFIPKRPGEPDITHASIDKIKRKLKWKPKVSIEEGIKVMMRNIKYWKNSPIWTPKKIRSHTKLWFKYLG